MKEALKFLRLLLHTPSGARRPIGYVSQFGDYHRVSFDADYVEDASRPTLSLSFRGSTEADTRAILLATRDARLVRSDGHLPAFFQNLLPEGHNRQRLARARGCDEDDELELLAAAGNDLFGAVEVEPVPEDDGIPEPVRLWHAAMGLELEAPEVVMRPVEDAASLPGVVTKFSAIKEGRRYVVKRHAQPGSYILKLPSTRHPDLVENELTGYRLAACLGLRCAEAQKVSRADAELPDAIQFSHVLAVKRFDRAPGGGRVHMEEMVQALGYPLKQKYGRGLEHDLPTMLRILDRLSAQPGADVREMVERFVAFVLMGNTDAHLKNWALLYPDGTTPVLSPLYDPVCVSAWFADLPPSEYALNRKIDDALRAVDESALSSILHVAGVERPSRLLSAAREVVAAAKSRWPALLVDAPDNVRRSVEGRLAGGVALAR